jgi:hypothetical protein
LGTEELATTHITHTERNNMANPYELRFEILKMAREYLQDQTGIAENHAEKAWDLALEEGNANMELYYNLRPIAYSVNDIKKKAEELYQFVEKK